MTSRSVKAQWVNGLIREDPMFGKDLFADESNFDLRFVESTKQITEIVDALRVLGMRVVLTSGSFDIIHEGHSMYLEAARKYRRIPYRRARQ